MHELKIPKDRVGCLVGTKGEVKKQLEKQLKVKLDISREGDVLIEGEGLAEYTCELIVKAIGRGFNPRIAVYLMNEEYFLEIIDMSNYIKKERKTLVRVKARLIGTNGRARRHLEKMTDTNIVVYGKTVSIIGKIEDVDIARRAIEKLLNGAPHSNVYRFITDELNKKRVI